MEKIPIKSRFLKKFYLSLYDKSLCQYMINRFDIPRRML